MKHKALKSILKVEAFATLFVPALFKPRYNSATLHNVQRSYLDQPSMMHAVLQYPIFGPEISCPHCRQTLPALMLTDTYLCHRHGAFEANPETAELVHLQSGRHWRQWDGEWYRQHTHPDGIRFEIHEALDRLYADGFRATRVVIAQRYRELLSAYLERAAPGDRNNGRHSGLLRLYGLPVEFGPDPDEVPQWGVVNFWLDKEPGLPNHSPYSRFFE